MSPPLPSTSFSVHYSLIIPPIDVISSFSSSGATVHDEPSPLLRLPAIVKSFSTVKALFTGWGRQPHAQSQIWRARVSLFVWIMTFDLSGMGNLPAATLPPA
jgi:hypothetical protein